MPENHFGERVAARYDKSLPDMFDPAVDLSEAMVARLRAKSDAAGIGVTIGDFATTRVDGTFSLAYLVFNTIGNLTTQATPTSASTSTTSPTRASSRTTSASTPTGASRRPPCPSASSGRPSWT